jgi:TonB family protein
MVWWLATLASLLVPVASFVKPVGTPSVIVAPLQVTTVVVSTEESAVRSLSLQEGLWIAWGVGFCLLLFRLGVGLVRSSQRRSSSSPSQISCDCAGVEIRMSDRITVPETFGLFRPVILLPIEASDWSDGRLKVVLAHESVHVQRRDWLTQLIAQFSACVYWFHPMVWFALARMRNERELACDDGVLRLGYRNTEYAQRLIDVARGIRSGTEELSPSVAMASQSQLETRVRAILNPTMNRGNVTTITKIAAMACTALVIVLFSSVKSSAAGATLSGAVTDVSGARVPEALIVLSPAEKGRKPIATTSSASGEWEIRTIEAGAYRLEIKKPGFKLYQQQATVVGDTPLRLDSRLDIGSLQETLTVRGKTTQTQSGDTPQRIRVGGNIQAAKLINRVMPEYPAHLKAAGITGSVILQAVIGREGEVLNIEVLSSEVHPDFIAVATEAVAKWKYEPTLLNGVAVEVLTVINVNFTLSQ